jgi:hypothetical protein
MTPTLPNPPPTVNASPIYIKGKNATTRVNKADAQLGIVAKNGFFSFGFIVPLYGITNDFLFLSLFILITIAIKRKITIITVTTIAFVLVAILPYI